MLGKRFDLEIEKKWQEEWVNHNVYAFNETDSTKPVYSIDTPPPFTSGKLHMGHVLSYSYFDFAARYKRMRGYNVYYPQGWDCQGFPTEVKVEKKYGRKDPVEFLKNAHEWTNQMITKMKAQMIQVGFSPDWKYEYKTIDPSYHKAVQLSLLKMHENELLYNSAHPVHWCPRCASAIAKVESNEIQRNAKLNYLKFKCEGREILVATTRPEMLHACVAVMYHPDDSNYTDLEGKQIETPLGKKVKFIADKDVDLNFGTGVVMVCTFGDKQDVVWAYRHNLEVIDAFDKYGKLINAGKYDGLKSAVAKKQIIEDLTNAGLVDKVEELSQVVKVHDRCGTPIELLRSKQWFIKVKDYSKQIVNDAKQIEWYPKFAITYLTDWAEFVEWDWVISRDRLLGTPIPFWYCPQCMKWYPANENELPVNPRLQDKKCPDCSTSLIGEKAVCDCWVDSSISPLVISKWGKDQAFFDKVYPCDLRPQGVEIIRTWAYYTIHRCSQLTGKVPFKQILLNGNVLAPDGKKMSKSLGNEVQPDELMKTYPADALRQWAALSGAMAKDRPFNYQDMKFAKSFLNKLWNASKFIESNLEGYQYDDLHASKLRVVDKWVLSRLRDVIDDVTNAFENYEFHKAIKTIQDYFWHEVCDYYLEYVKYRIYSDDENCKDSKLAAQYTLYNILINIVKLVAPIMPHIAEEIYQVFYPQTDKFVVQSVWPEPYTEWHSPDDVVKANLLNSIITEIRQHKSTNQMSMKSEIQSLKIKTFDDLTDIIEEIKQVGIVKELVIEEGKFEVIF